MVSATWKTRADLGLERPETAPLSVYVLKTRSELLRNAICKAHELSKDLRASVVVVAAQVVPYPRGIDDSPVAKEFVESRLREEAGRAEILILFCRDREQAFAEALPKGSLVVLGGRKRRWKTAEDSLAKRLRAAGHQVVMVYA